MMAAKVLEEKKITREDREQMAELVRLYLTGELETMIEFEALKAESEPATGGTDYSSCTGGSGGQGVNVIEQFDNNRRRALWRKNRLVRIRKMMRLAFRMINGEGKKILELFYIDKCSILIIAGKLGHSERTIKRKKRTTLDQLCTHIDLGRCKII